MPCPTNKDAFNADAWGPVAWHHLHTVGFAFPENPSREEREDMTLFLRYFAATLPCGDCRSSFQEILFTRFKPNTHLVDCDSISRFLFLAHNEVNAKLGKAVVPKGKYAIVRKYYESMRHPKAKTKTTLIIP